MSALSLSAQLKRWSKLLQPSSDSARLDAEILLKHVSGLNDSQLIIRDNEPLDDNTIQRVNTLVEARCQGSPIAYLTGWREFYSLNLSINQHVLIPRPETELLVDIVLNLIQPMTNPEILELGTGSGAIAVAIAANAKNARLLATDIDDKALQIAAKNAQNHHLDTIKFLSSDWYSNLGRQHFDLITSNPPYIDPDDPHLRRGDVRFEPEHALVAADHGCADIVRIIELAPAYLKPGGWIVLEHGYNQGKITRELLKDVGFIDTDTLKDLNQHDRVTLGRWSAR